jgi:hypothetical protein
LARNPKAKVIGVNPVFRWLKGGTCKVSL